MGSGGSKKADDPGKLSASRVPSGVEPELKNFNRERRHSHVETNPPAASDVLVQCQVCNRKFASDRIQKHMQVKELYLELVAYKGKRGELECCTLSRRCFQYLARDGSELYRNTEH